MISHPSDWPVTALQARMIEDIRLQREDAQRLRSEP